MGTKIGKFDANTVIQGDCLDLIQQLPDKSIDIMVTSPPYWGQRTSLGSGVEDDPRHFVEFLVKTFTELLPKLKDEGIIWINIGDAYNTPVNWREEDYVHSTLGADKKGLSPTNSAYVKNRAKRKAFIDKSTPWLKYGNLLALPYRMVIGLCDAGYYYRGEVIWKKQNPMPEGRARRPHRYHEAIYLLTKNQDHSFQVSPPVKSVWEFANEAIKGKKHYSRFPFQLPYRCIQAYGKTGNDIVVLDPYSGSGTTGLAALNLGCTYLGFEIDPEQVTASNERILEYRKQQKLL